MDKTFGRKVLVSAAAAAAVAHDWLVTLTKAHQHTNTPNTHTLSFSPYRCMVHGVFFAELSLEVGFAVIPGLHAINQLPTHRECTESAIVE